MTLHFANPYFLLLLFIPAVWLLWLFRKKKREAASVAYSSLGLLRQCGVTLRQRLLWVPHALYAISLLAMILAMARPQAGSEPTRDIRRGIAMELVLDRSSSMSLDILYHGQWSQRLLTAKRILRDFLLGNSRLAGRPDDLAGLIVFSRYADTIAPLTLVHTPFPDFLQDIEIAAQEEDGTAIGDALALAAARLHSAGKKQDPADKRLQDYEIKSKIIILLTDGENNCGRRNITQAGELLKKWGVRLYVIAITGRNATVAIPSPFGGTVRQKVEIPPGNTEELQLLAEATGGFLKNADDGAAIENTYAEIDALERTEIESVLWNNYRELCGPLLLTASALLLAAFLLQLTIFRKIP